jgi:hypothetical protein
MKMEQTQCSETLAFKLHVLENNPEEHDEKFNFFFFQWAPEAGAPGRTATV